MSADECFPHCRHSDIPFFQGIVQVTVPLSKFRNNSFCQNSGTVPLSKFRNSSFFLFQLLELLLFVPCSVPFTSDCRKPGFECMECFETFVKREKRSAGYKIKKLCFLHSLPFTHTRQLSSRNFLKSQVGNSFFPRFLI